MGRPKKNRGGRVTPKGSTALAPRPGGAPADRGPGGDHASEPVRPGLVGLGRSVPPEIARPPYAETGEPGERRSGGHVQTPDVITRMRRAGELAAEVLIRAGEAVEAGITTDAIDRVVHDATLAAGAYPSPLNYRGFPKSVCTSVNEVICHGIPDSRALRDGDIVNVDVTVYLDGVHGDTNATFLVGNPDADSRRLVAETLVCLERAIEAVKPGAPINVIGRAIQDHAHSRGLGVVREFIGHGIGEEFHTTLQIPHYFDPSARTPLEEGMTFTIEPMITLGDPSLYVWSDGWTAVTRDGSRSAQFEHMLVVTSGGAEVLTLGVGGRTAHELFRPRS